MMHIGQEFYKTKPSADDIIESNLELVNLLSIKYRHGVSKDHCVYNLDIANCNTFFANGILGHNYNPKDNDTTDKEIIEVEKP
jgi:hypothetical protein